MKYPWNIQYFPWHIHEYAINLWMKCDSKLHSKDLRPWHRRRTTWTCRGPSNGSTPSRPAAAPKPQEQRRSTRPKGADGGVKRWRMNDNEIPPDTHTQRMYISMYTIWRSIWMDPEWFSLKSLVILKNVPSEHYTMSFLFYGLRLRGLSGSIEKCCSFLLIRFEHGLGY